MILKFICKDKRPSIDNTVLKQKNKVGGLILLDSEATTKLL